MKIVQDFIGVGRNNRPGYTMTPKYITIHDTGNASAGANAKVHASYIKSDACASRETSWHFTVDSGDTIYQHLPLNENGWHCGDSATGTGNRQSIGIETCINSDGHYPTTLNNAQWLVAKLMKEHNIPIENVVQHNRWSGKDCPRVIRSTTNGWSNFIQGVKNQLNPPNNTVIGTGIVISAPLNIRSGAGMTSSILGQLSLNDKVDVVGISGEWYEIKHGVGTAFIYAEYVKYTALPQVEYEYYTVVSGDVLSRIAVRFNTTTDALVKLNNIANAGMIFPGQKLKIREISVVVPAPTPTPTPQPIVEPTVPKKDYDEMVARVNTLQTQLNASQSNFDGLNANHVALQSKYNSLVADIKAVANKY